LSHPHYQIMTWIRVADRFQKFLPLESECLLPCSQKRFTCPCREPNESVHALQSYFCKVYCNTILPSNLGLPRLLFLSALLTKTLLPFVFCPMRATSTAHAIHLDLVTQGTSSISFETFSDPPLASLFYLCCCILKIH
jgi:hypothetical protein